MPKSIYIKGEEEFHEAVKKLIKSVKPDKIEPILFKSAQIITRASKKDAPEGPTGNLKKAIRTRKLKRIFGNPAPAISAIDRKKAPHAHLVHDSTGRDRVGGPRSKRYRGRRFGKMPMNPFHRKAWDAKRGEVLSYIEKNVKQLIEGAAR